MKAIRTTTALVSLVAAATLMTACDGSEVTASSTTSSSSSSSSSTSEPTSSSSSTSESSSASSSTSSTSESSSSSSTADSSPKTTVKMKELETDIKSKLEAQGTPIDKVECPSQVEAKSGEKTTCKVTAKDGRTKDYEVTITSVSGTDVRYSAKPKA